jgi:iron(III) transport system substrate-binding protein
MFQYMVKPSPPKLVILFACLFSVFFSASAIAVAQTEAELINGAKKEGRVSFWSGMRLDDARALAQGFEAKYPFLKTDIFRLSGEQLINRTLAESTTGKTNFDANFDVMIAFALQVLQDKGLLQPYVSPEAKHYPTGFKDQQNYWVSLYSGYNVIGINTKLVSAGEAPKDWPDLLQPRWKGKLAMEDEEYFWYAGMLNYGGEPKRTRYMEALARQDIHWQSEHGVLMDLLSAGEYPIGVVVYPDRIEQMKAKGQPVDWITTSDPILVNLAPIGIAAKTSNPNAAKLFLNYAISKEGQTILQKSNRISARSDIAPIVPSLDPKKLRLVPLDPAIATKPKPIQEYRATFGLK